MSPARLLTIAFACSATLAASAKAHCEPASGRGRTELFVSAASQQTGDNAAPADAAAGAPGEVDAPVAVQNAAGVDSPELAARLAERRALLGTLFDGCLLDSSNGQDFVETAGYRRALEILFSYPRDEVAKRVVQDFNYAECVAEPDLWRGEFVRIRGLLVGAWAVRLQRPLGEHVDVWRGLVTETDVSEGVLFDMLERPSDGLVDGRSIVDIEGLVYRTVHYESQAGIWQNAPYLLVRTLSEVDTTKLEKQSLLEPFFMVLVAAAGAFFVVRILMTMNKRSKGAGRSKPPDFDELFQRAARKPAASPKNESKG